MRCVIRWVACSIKRADTDAVIAHERFLKSGPRDRVKYEWFLGWSHFGAGDALCAAWDNLISHRNLLVGPKALYWTALLRARRRRAFKTLKRLKRDAELGYGPLGVTFEARLKGRAIAGEIRSRRRGAIIGVRGPLQHQRIRSNDSNGASIS